VKGYARVALVLGGFVALFGLGAAVGLTAHSGGGSTSSTTTRSSVSAHSARPRRAKPHSTSADHAKSPGPGRPAGVGLGLAASDGQYALQMQTPNLAVGSDQVVSFKLTRAAGGVVGGSQLLDGPPMQLILMSADLRFLTRVTPTAARDGHWSATVDVPAPGPYAVFVHFKHRGAEHSLGAWLSAPGPVASSVALEPALVARAGPMTVALNAVRIQAGRRVRLDFRVTVHGKPVATSSSRTGLDGFLFGARASDLTQVYGSRVRAGPSTPGRTSFDAQFPAAGIYRLFLTLRPASGSITTELAVEVHPGP
jgi:hypothetical protein